MRNQEIWALTLGDIAGRRATVREVLSYGTLDTGKTEGATGRARRPPIDALLADDLAVWTAALAAAGYGTSVEMLERNYSFAIEDLEDEGPKPAAEERALARALAPSGRRRHQRAA